MPRQSLEDRVLELESQFAELQAVVRQSHHSEKDWRKSIGAFTDDPGMQQILKDAMRLREEDREKARRKHSAKRKRSR